MSLINKMLRDLEARQEPITATPVTKPVYQDLQSVRVVRRRSLSHALKPILIVAVGCAVGYFSWNAWQSSAIDKPQVVAAAVPSAATTLERPLAAPVSPPAASAQTPPEPAVIPTPVAPMTPPAITETTEPVNEAQAAPRPEVDKGPATQLALASPPKASPAPVTPARRPVVRTDASGDDQGAMEIRMRPQTAREHAESRYRQALSLVERGRGDEAMRLLQSALAGEPAHVKARELLAGLSLKNGHTREARQLLEEGMTQSPEYYQFAQLLARLYVEQGADGRALELLEGARAAAGHDPNFHALSASVYQRVGRHADAVASYRRVLEAQPHDSRAWLGLAISLEAQKQPVEAVRAYQRVRQSENLPASLALYAEQRLVVLGSKNP